jgi:hypothetical protein
MREVSTIGLDLAEKVLQVYGADALTSWQRVILDLGARVAGGRVQVGASARVIRGSIEMVHRMRKQQAK